MAISLPVQAYPVVRWATCAAQPPEQPAVVGHDRGSWSEGLGQHAPKAVAGASADADLRARVDRLAHRRVGHAAAAAWGSLDRRLSRETRVALVVSPLVFSMLWFGLSAWAHATGHLFGGEGRLAFAGGGDISSSRFAIWSNTLAMIAREPWVGVGFGEFNFAWTLTAFPDRPTAFFDHTHNLPLQLLVEMGVPLGYAGDRCCCWSRSVQAWRRAWAMRGRRRRIGASRRLHDGVDDRPAQHARVPAVVRLLPAAGGIRVGLCLSRPRPVAPRSQRRPQRRRRCVTGSTPAARLPCRTGDDLRRRGRRARLHAVSW